MATKEEEVFHLFDLYWFKNQILTNPKTPSTSPTQEQTHKQQQSTIPMTIPSLLHVITPSIEDHPWSSKDDVESPTSVLALSKETEPFSKEEEAVKIKIKNKNNDRRKKAGPKKSSRVHKSLTELEHDELKGFMELGFEFPKEAMKMMEWRIPSLSNENDMKKHLRIWAHAVASIVKHA